MVTDLEWGKSSPLPGNMSLGILGGLFSPHLYKELEQSNV